MKRRGEGNNRSRIAVRSGDARAVGEETDVGQRRDGARRPAARAGGREAGRSRALDGSIAPRLLESNPSRGGGVSNPSSARGPRGGGAPVRAKERRREGLVLGRSSRSSRTLLGPGAALERGGARSAARGRVAELGGARGEGAAEHDGVDRVGRRRRDARREDGEGVASARSRTHAGGDPFRARRERPRDARCAFVWW